MTIIINEHDTIDPQRLEALHEVHDECKVEALAESMRAEGWIGRSILVLDETMALSGTHRLAAAIEAGIEVPIYRISAGAWDPDTAEEQQWAADLADARDDEERLAILEQIGDAEAIEIMTAEIEASNA
ncbi:MAG: ParB N-terminal domain-containing protein [Acidobacteriota bacterium]